MIKRLWSVLVFSFCLSCSWNAESAVAPDTPNTEFEKGEEARLSWPSTGLYCGFKDSNGNFWFGTRGEGVYVYDGVSYTHMGIENGLSSNNISTISEDHEGRIWFGVPDGACWFDGSRFTHIPVPWTDTSSVWLDKVYPVVNPNQVMSIHADNQVSIWLGTNGAGVYRYKDNVFEQFLERSGMVYEDGQYHNIILSITNDTSGNLWFSSLSHGGVVRYDGNSFTHYVSELSDDFVRVVYCDREGKIWVGTHGNHKGGVDRFDGQSFQAFHKTDDGFRHNNVLNIYQDINGLFWMGSGTTELALFDGHNFRTFSGAEGQSFTRVQFILDDANGHIWFGGIDGLWRYDGINVEDMRAL